MKWSETVASKCRWAELVAEVLSNLATGTTIEVLWEESCDDYQGSAKFIAKIGNDQYIHYSWTYGSCEGCDVWEGQPSEEVKAEMQKTMAVYSFDGLKSWLTILEEKRAEPDWDNGMMEAIRKEIAPKDLPSSL